MAKKIGLGIQQVHYGFIHVDLGKNKRAPSDYKDPKDIINSMARVGFVGYNAKAYLLSEEEQKAALAYREAHIADLTNRSIKDEAAEKELNMLRHLWFDNGKLTVPVIGNNSCFRRLSNVPMAMALRQKLKAEEKERPDEDILPMISVEVKHYADDNERVADQLRENGLEKEGAVEMSFISKVLACVQLFLAGWSESKLQTILGNKRGTAQKVFGFLKTDSAVPEARILERAQLPATIAEGVDNPDYFPAVSVTPQQWRDLFKDGKKPTLEDIEALERKVKDPEGNAPKVLEGKIIRAQRDRTKNRLGKQLLEQIVEAKADILSSLLAKYEKPMNELERLATFGKLDEAVKALQAIETPVVTAPVEEAVTA